MVCTKRALINAAGWRCKWQRFRKFALVVPMMCFALGSNQVSALGEDEDGDERGRFCSATASYLFNACSAEATDDLFKAKAICININHDAERMDCLAEAKSARGEADRTCRAQLAGRRKACKLLGEDRYDPAFEPAMFEEDFSRPTNPNRYLPLAIGNKWEYHGGGEINLVEVLNETKLIKGVRCIVVQDIVLKDGELVEDTDDWFALAKNGDVYYCGEEVKDYESFDGDAPKLPELVSIDGSFKWGRDGDKGGLFFRAVPFNGDAYLEEFSLGNAEDVTEVLTTTYAFGLNRELDRFVPRRLVEIFCASDCVVTKNYSLLEPGIFARKYYASGIGVILEVNPQTGESIQLVHCNFDWRCNGLPRP